MDINTAKEALLKRSNAFRERYFTAYGQLVLRVNEETYISSRENLRLSKLTEKDFDLFDINTGDIGRIFSSRDDINAIVFICTEAAVRFSKENQIMRPALDDLAQIIGPDVTVCPDGTARTLLKALRNRRGCFIQGSGIIAVGGYHRRGHRRCPHPGEKCGSGDLLRQAERTPIPESGGCSGAS